MPNPSARDLLVRGLFHDRIVPPLSSLSLEDVYDDVVAFARVEMAKKSGQRKRPLLARHSVPKLKHLRRHFGIPNPYAHIMLCLTIGKHWRQMKAVCDKSQISLSKPVASAKRALAAEHSRRVEGVRRAQSSVGARFMLKTDLATFYPSIYTHSIPWAIHGKQVARSARAKNWFGNQLDVWVQGSQDRQTGGIPIGPDSSFLIAEVIASRIDERLQKELGTDLHEVRYIDDYHLYFRTRADAERALAALHTVTRSFELQLNGLKTEIVELPESIEPAWKTDLRLLRIRSDARATGIKAYFDRAATLAHAFPTDSVLTYAVRKITHYMGLLKPHEWEVCRSLMMRCCLGEPTMLPVLLPMFGVEPQSWTYDELQLLLTELCLYHAPLQHGFEVAWSLWTARSLRIALSAEVAAVLRKVDDDIVALVALDLEAEGLLSATNSSLWKSRMTAEALYSDHWLLAYEALVKGWLPSKDGTDYVAADPFFSILQGGDVAFYDVDEPWEDGYSDYSDGDDEVWDDDDDDDDDLDGNSELPPTFPGAAVQPINPFAIPIPPWLQETMEPVTAPTPETHDGTPEDGHDL